MENCPFCDAPGSYREATDGSCYVCGMMLPNLSSNKEPNVATAVAEPVEEIVESSGTPGRDEPTIFEEPVVEPTAAPTIFMENTEPPAIELIHPRNLSPEYARRVTAAWQATKSPFKNPLETINSSTTPAIESPDLLIRSRVVGKMNEVEQADYELKEVIGEGAMGTVWSARQMSLNREIALKVPKPSASGSSFGRQLFISEVVVTGQLDHPNIVPIYDLARDETGQLFYAMKRVEGRSWDTCMHETGVTRHGNLEILMKVCDAVRFAHDRKVIHRDIKPQNIMVGKFGEVSVMDWGIALRLPEGTHIPGMAKISPSGTPAYMAPEMATGNANEIGWHTDVYLLGAVLYEIITGDPPHPAPTGTSDPYVQQKACLLIAARNVITPAKETGELVDIAYKAMATDIYDRYASVDEFQSAIRDYFAHAESIALTDRGDQHLTNAREARNGVYEDYAKARFAFDEAIQLWPENSRAHHGLSQATHDYAGSALERGDYALGLSLLKADNPAHADLTKKLRAAKRKHDRNRFAAFASAVAAASFLVLGITGVSILWYRESAAKLNALASEKTALRAKEDATRARNEAVSAKDQETKAKEDAIAAAGRETKAKNDALAAKAEETKAKNDAVSAEESATVAKNQAIASAARETAAKQQVQQASYKSEIGLASEEVRRNAFANALTILANQASNETQSARRNWEWGHLMYLAKEPSSTRFEVGGAAHVEAVAISPDQKWLAASTDDGQLNVWLRSAPNQPALKLPLQANRQSEPITSLAISNDNKLLAVASGNEVQFWRLPSGDPGRGLASAGKSIKCTSKIHSIALSTNADMVLTGNADSTAQLWSLANPEKRPQMFTGHLSGPVWQASFSPDGQSVVTAGDDESVRVWSVKDGAQLRKLEGHSGPVYAASFSPDGKHIVSGGRDRRLLAWDLQLASASQAPADAVRQTLQTAAEPDQSKNIHQLGEQHAAAIHCLSFSPDGKVLFSGSDDNSLRVWDVSGGVMNGRLTKSLRGHGGWVRSCAAASDGEHVVSGSYDGQVYVWDWKAYAFPRVLRPESRTLVRFTSAAASPDAHWIATAAEDGVVSMWNMTNPLNPTAQALTEGHDWQATTGVYFEDGRRLLTAGGDNAALIWDTRSGNQLVRIGGYDAKNGTGWRGVGAASHNGRWIATGSNDKSILAKLWDSQTGRLVASLASTNSPQADQTEGPEAAAIAFALDDQTVFIGDQSGHGYLFGTADGKFIKPVAGHTRKINAASYLPNGNLLTASSDGAVIEWNLGTGQAEPRPEHTLQHFGRVVAFDVSRDGKSLVTATDSEDEEAVLRLWDLQTGKRLQQLTLSELVGPERISRKNADQQDDGTNRLPAIRSVAFHPNQPQALVTLFDPEASTYQLGTWNWTNKQAAVSWISTGLRDTSMAVYSPKHDGSILTVGGRGARVRLANQVVMNYRPQSRVQSVGFSPNSQLVASAGEDGSIKLWRLDGATNRWMPDRKLIEHRGSVNSVAFHPKRNDVLLSAGDDGTTRLWRQGADGWSATTLRTGKDGNAHVQQAIFSPADENGAADILTASDNSVSVWNIDGKQLSTLAIDRPIRCLSVSPDRKWLVAGVGNEAWVWSRASLAGAPVHKLPGHSAEITAIAFSKDGQRLFTAGRDFHVKLWDASSWNVADQKQPSRELLTLEQHTDSVVSLALFPSDKYPALLSAGADGQAILWPSVDWH